MPGRRSLAFLGGLLLFVLVSRAVFWTTHPPNFDFVNFALGVERFAPKDHQPHPPGYPLVILIAKILAGLGIPVVTALYLVGMLGSLLAVWGAWRLGGGPLGALLLAVHPVFWYSGVSSPVRAYLAAGACWLLLGCWKMAKGSRHALWLTFAGLAIFAGFRPELLIFFALPCLVAARLGHLPWTAIARAAGLCLVLCLPWMVWVAVSFGSPWEVLYNYFYYFLHHASTTSGLLGAPTAVWQSMLEVTLWWVASMLIPLDLALWVGRRELFVNRQFLWPAALFFIPAFFVQLAIHQTSVSPDQSLGTIAVLCVMTGGWFGSVRRGWILGAIVAIILAAVSFLPGHTGNPALDVLSLPAFARGQREQAEQLGALRSTVRKGDVLLVLTDSLVSWRIVAWEFPQNTVLAPDAALTTDVLGGGWRFEQRRLIPLAGENLGRHATIVIASSPRSPQMIGLARRWCTGAPCFSGPWYLRVSRPPVPPSPRASLGDRKS